MDILCNLSADGNGRALPPPWLERAARVVAHATRMLAALNPVDRAAVVEMVNQIVAEERR